MFFFRIAPRYSPAARVGNGVLNFRRLLRVKENTNRVVTRGESRGSRSGLKQQSNVRMRASKWIRLTISIKPIGRARLLLGHSIGRIIPTRSTSRLASLLRWLLRHSAAISNASIRSDSRNCLM